MASYNSVFKDELWMLVPYAWGTGGESHGFLNQALGYSRRQDMSVTLAQKCLAAIPTETDLPGFLLIIHNPEVNRNPGMVFHGRLILVGATWQWG